MSLIRNADPRLSKGKPSRIQALDKKLCSDAKVTGQLTAANHAAINELLGAQIVAALQDLFQSEVQINEFFNHVRHSVDGLVDWIDAMEEKSLEMAAAHESLLGIRNAASNSIQTLQSFDRIEQRLRHVIQNLDHVSVAENTDAEYLMEIIEASYSLEHEHHLMNRVRNGAGKQELMEDAARPLPPSGDGELF